jgi:FlaA1/EpsC-like NDP-sugar epimerase
MSIFSEQRLVVTGSCGTIGAELFRQLLNNPSYAPAEVIGPDNNENALFFQDQEFLSDERAKFYQCDIRNKKDL